MRTILLLLCLMAGCIPEYVPDKAAIDKIDKTNKELNKQLDALNKQFGSMSTNLITNGASSFSISTNLTNK